MSSPSSTEKETPAAPDKAAAAGGYRLSEHVQNYYRTTRV